MRQDPPTSTTLADARNLLSQGTEQCQREIQGFLKKRQAQKRNEKDAERSKKECFGRVLEMVGHSLFLAIQTTIGPDEGLDVYFWPGYQSISGQEAPSRLTLRAPMLPGSTAECEGGIGYSAQQPQTPYRSLESARWYADLLSPERAHTAGRLSFFPGGTHNWITQTQRPRLNPTGGELIPLRVLAVGNSQHAPCGVDKDGLLGIRLFEDDVERWGGEIAAILNKDDRVHSVLTWPHPYESVVGTKGKGETIQGFREALYSAWIASSIGTDWPALRHRLAREFRTLNLIEIAELLESGSIKSCAPHGHRFWYTISLDEWIFVNPEHTADTSDLGSVMLLSSRQLDTDFLMLARRWVEYIYTMLRYVEGATMREQRGSEEQASRFAHQTLSIIEAIHQDLDDCDILGQLNVTTRGLWTTLLADVEIYRGLPHAPDKPFAAAGDRPMETYIRVAAGSALLKMEKHRKSVKLYRFVTEKMRHQPQVADSVLKELALDTNVMTPESADQTIRSESFGVLAVHCLAQAFYHTLMCKCQNPELFERPVIKVTTSGPLLRFEVWNPGPISGFEKGSRDEDELRRMGNYFAEDGMTDGPVPDEIKGWLTSFELPLIEEERRR